MSPNSSVLSCTLSPNCLPNLSCAHPHLPLFQPWNIFCFPGISMIDQREVNIPLCHMWLSWYTVPYKSCKWWRTATLPWNLYEPKQSFYLVSCLISDISIRAEKATYHRSVCRCLIIISLWEKSPGPWFSQNVNIPSIDSVTSASKLRSTTQLLIFLYMNV